MARSNGKVSSYTVRHGEKAGSKHVVLRKEIIAELRQESSLSVRQIAELYGVGRNIGHRVR
jgi:hypothetical protein